MRSLQKQKGLRHSIYHEGTGVLVIRRDASGGVTVTRQDSKTVTKANKNSVEIFIKNWLANCTFLGEAVTDGPAALPHALNPESSKKYKLIQSRASRTGWETDALKL